MIGVIVNPNSKRNRKQRNLRKELEAKLKHLGVVIETPSVKHLPRALHTLRKKGCKYWLADGGDGALHWMINVALEHMGPSILDEVTFIPGNGGTINYVSQAVGLRGRSTMILDRILSAFDAGHEPEVKRVPSSWLYCTKVDEKGKRLPAFNILSFGSTFAGYTANFFGPFYEGDLARGPLRIIAVMSAAYTVGVGRAVFQGPIRHLKPKFMRRAEHTYLRPIHAEAWVDKKRFTDSNKKPVTAFTVIECSSIPLDLGVFQVFPLANEKRLHVHIGAVTAIEFLKSIPKLVFGKNVNNILETGYDGPCETVKISCHPGNVMTPVLDGELYHNIVEVEVSLGPRVRIAVV